MDTRTGELLTEEEATKRASDLRSLLGEAEARKRIVQLPAGFVPTPNQLKHNRIGRNDPCPCGSGKKFKKCCMTAQRPQGR